jgi:N-acetyl-gamma-glutamyl-phosphate reductase
MNSKTNVAVIGATGYAGSTAATLLLSHPEARLTVATSRSYAGQRLGDVVPGFDGDIVLGAEPDPGDAGVVIVALPHGMTAGLAKTWRREGRSVVDLGADFRLQDQATYKLWYGLDHPAPELLESAVLGLPEVYGADLPGANLIACPGCYSTAAILALYPAFKLGLAGDEVVVDAASGVSGAGRSLALGSHFAETAEDYRAYAVGGHRHKPEVTQVLVGAGARPRLTFVPHLVPMVRGILATCYLDAAPGQSVDSIRDAYRDFYAGAAFVDVVGTPPSTKMVSGTNRALIHVTEQDGKLIILAAIDNLMKGAAGQGIQALNLAMGWPETCGLAFVPRWP